MTTNQLIDDKNLPPVIPENPINQIGELDPLIPAPYQTQNSVSENARPQAQLSLLDESKETICRMLRYAIANPEVKVSGQLISDSVHALAIKPESMAKEDEVLLWKTYAELAQLINPVTDISIQITEGLKDMVSSTHIDHKASSTFEKTLTFLGFNTKKSNLVRRCQQDLTLITLCLLLFVSTYVVTQCYIALLSETLTHSSQLLGELKTQKAAELLINDQTSTNQSSQIRAEIEALFLQMNASSKALTDLTKPIQDLSIFQLSDSTLASLSDCAANENGQQQGILKCIYLERKYASSTYIVLSRYVLPLLLGFIGATAYVTRNTLSRLSTNSYVPSPRGMLTMRLCLGGLLGAISGIFVSADSNEAQGFNISLTLTALLMGYSVEVAFSLFDSAIYRVRNWTKALKEATPNNTISAGEAPNK